MNSIKGLHFSSR